MKSFDNAEFAWAVTGDGISKGCCMLKLKPDDMVKIGRLYLGGGRWVSTSINNRSAAPTCGPENRQ